MSIENYKKALEVIDRKKERCDFIGPRQESLIRKAEERLGIRFSGMYLDFLERFGTGNIGSHEIFGLIDDEFDDSSVPDAIWYTITERLEFNLPDNLLIIYNDGMGDLICLDFKHVGIDNEPFVISYVPGVDYSMQEYEVVAKDFGDFLLEIVESQFSN